ncbi:hypothetical protein [Rhodococcus koreensis]
MGALSQTGYLLTVYQAIGLGASTGTTALIDGTQPLVVAVLAGPLLGQNVAARQWWGRLALTVHCATSAVLFTALAAFFWSASGRSYSCSVRSRGGGERARSR